jgi:ribosomal protein S18 acetylase RimI-like enzyme
MSSEIVIRPCKPEDEEDMVAAALAAWAPLFESLLMQRGEELYLILQPQDWQEMKADQIRSACRDACRLGTGAAVAEKDGRVVGFVTFLTHNGWGIGEIGNNAVHPDFQGLGIGPKLYRYVFRELRRAGVQYVQVLTGCDDFHARARKAYESVGFAMPYADVTYYRRLTEADE